MISNQGIKEVFLEEAAPQLDLQGWVGSEHTEKDRQGRTLHAEETASKNRGRELGVCKRTGMTFAWLQLRMSDQECLRLS